MATANIVTLRRRESGFNAIHISYPNLQFNLFASTSDRHTSTGVAADDNEAILRGVEAASTDDGSEAFAVHSAQELAVRPIEQLDGAGLPHAANDEQLLARHGRMPLGHKGRQPATCVVVMTNLLGGLNGARERVHIVGEVEVIVHRGGNDGLAAGREEGTVDRFAGMLSSKGFAPSGRLVNYLGRLELTQIPELDGTIQSSGGQDVAVGMETTYDDGTNRVYRI